MINSVLFAMLIILILGALYIMKGGDNPAEIRNNQDPKEPIGLVEQKKAARQAAEAMQQSLQQSAEKSNQALESIRNQQ